MPQNETEATLLVQYNDVASTYSYAQLSLLSVLPDASQVEVRWDVDTVENNAGAVFDVESLSANVQATIKTLVLDTHYTIDVDTKEITLLPANITGGTVTVEGGVEYIYPTFALSPSQNLQIRRATDITDQVVTFQPGSRLTSDNLNLANGQLFNALQELTVFGISSGGVVSSIDLTNSEINDLGNVNLGANGLLSWDGANVTSGGDAGNLLPSTSGLDNAFPTFADVGKVPMYGQVASGDDVFWEFVTFDDVRDGKTGTNTLTSRLTSIENRIGVVEGDTQDLSAPSTGNSTFSGNLTVTSDLDVTGALEVTGDLTVTGDIIRSGPYFWQLPMADSSDITGTNGSKTLGSTAFGFSEGASSFEHSSTNADSDFDFDSGIWTAPRDMVVSVSMTWSLTPASGSTETNSLGRVFLEGINVGGPIYNETGGPGRRRSATKTVVFPVLAGNTVELVVQRDGGDTFRAENTEACLHEVR